MADKRIRGIVDTELFDYGPERSRMLVASWRLLANGEPVGAGALESMVRTLGMNLEDALDFLSSVTERDGHGQVTGVLGLSLNDHPHDFIVNGRHFSTWCAMDTLFLPAMLGVDARVSSKSPVSGERIELIVTPDGPSALTPTTAVVSLPVVRAAEVDTSTTEGIWSAFCHRIYFFASENEANVWIEGRGEMEVVSVEQAWRHAMQTWERVLPFARQAFAAA